MHHNLLKKNNFVFILFFIYLIIEKILDEYVQLLTHYVKS